MRGTRSHPVILTLFAATAACSTAQPPTDLPWFVPDGEKATIGLLDDFDGGAIVIHRPSEWPGGLILVRSDAEPNVLAAAVVRYRLKRNRLERGYSPPNLSEETDSTRIGGVTGEPPNLEWAGEVLSKLRGLPRSQLAPYGPVRVAPVRISCMGPDPDPLEAGPCRRRPADAR